MYVRGLSGERNVELIWIVPISGLLAVVVAGYLAWDVLGRDIGPATIKAHSDGGSKKMSMQEVADTIYEGAVAFLDRQYRTIAVFALVGAIGISLLLAGLRGGDDALSIAWHTGLAFVIGAICSGLAGLIGMFIAVKANLRTAVAARTSLGDSLTIALRGGAVSGLLVVALSLLGVYGLFELFRMIDVANGISEADALKHARN